MVHQGSVLILDAEKPGPARGLHVVRTTNHAGVECKTLASPANTVPAATPGTRAFGDGGSGTNGPG